MNLQSIASVALLWSIFAGTPPTSGSASDHGVEMDRVIADILHRQRAMARVRYTLSGEVLTPQGRLSRLAGDLLPRDVKGDVPASDHVAGIERVVTIDFADNRLRKDTSAEDFFTSPERMYFYPTFKSERFDGSRVVLVTPRKDNTSRAHTPPEFQPDLSLQKLSYLGLMLQFSDEPLFLAHGRFPRVGTGGGSFTRLQAAPDPQLLHWHGTGNADGAECVVVRTRPTGPSERSFYEYWLRLDRSSAVSRIRVFVDDQELRRCDINQEQSPVGWFPKTFVCTELNQDGSLAMKETWRVSGMIPDPPVDVGDFRAELAPGLIVYDAASNTRYRAGGPGAPNVDVRTLATTGRAPMGGVWALVVVAAVGVAVWLISRRRARRRESGN